MTAGSEDEGGGDCRIIHGDAAAETARLPDESVRCVCTDPPYGLGLARLDWDKRLPGARVWRECARVMEPGAWAFVACSPCQDLAARMIAALEGAGLDMSYPPILWTFATGFSRAKSVKEIAERFGRASGGPDADGSYLGYVPKPAVELILVGMRPPRRKGMQAIDQYEENGLAVTHMDDCRIPYAGDADRNGVSAGYYVPADGRPMPPGSSLSKDGTKIRVRGKRDERGRFPSHLLCSGGALDDGRPRGPSRGTYSRYFDLDAWAAERMTLAVTSATKPRKGERDGGLGRGSVGPSPIVPEAGNGGGGGGGGGGAGRDTPYARNARLRLNNHPAVKPIALFAYLLHLGTRPGDTVLDPFVGTGTAALAAAMTGRRCIGIERSERYVAIARERLRGSRTTARMEAFT